MLRDEPKTTTLPTGVQMSRLDQIRELWAASANILDELPWDEMMHQLDQEDKDKVQAVRQRLRDAVVAMGVSVLTARSKHG